MALSVSSLYTSGSTPQTGSPFTTSSFTPANNSLLVVAVTAIPNSALTISGGGLTWTDQKNLSSTAGGWTTETHIWTAPVTTGSSMTVTITNGSHFIIEVLQATGYNTSTPIGATGSLDTGNSGTLSNITFSLSASPASSSYLYSCSGRVVNNTATGVTAGAGWTRSANAGDGGFTGGTEYITGTTSSTVTWANIATGDTYFDYGGAIVAVEILAASGGGNTTPADCSMVFLPSANLRHPATVDTNQPRDNMLIGWGQPAPTQLAFWFQPPFLGPVPKSTQNTNQSFNSAYAAWSATNPTPGAFWLQPTPDLQRHIPTIYTAQSFVCNPTIGPPVPGWYTQAPALLKHPNTLDTNQPQNTFYAGWTNNTPSAFGFWTQPQDLLHHPATIDTNPPFNAGFAGQANVTPTQFGFWLQVEDLLHHPVTIDTRLQFAFNPPPSAATTSDCSFLFQSNALLNHPQTVDTNQSLDDTFFGWQQNVTPTAFGFWVEAPSLLQHPATVDTNQSFVFNPPPGAVTTTDCSFLFQPSALLNHAATLDTNQPLNDAFNGRAGVTPSALGFWTQAPDLIRHPVTIDTNQSRVSYQDKATPASFGFWIQASVLSRHTNTIDTNQSFVFNPPTPGATPSAFWWYEPPALLRHPPHLDTNQPRLVRQVGATPATLAWWRQPEDLLKHPVTINTQQSFKYLPPPQPPFGWLVQPQVLLRHPVPFILGGQYSFALLPPVIQANRLIKVYFFD